MGVTPQQFEQLKQRLRHPRRPEPLAPAGGIHPPSARHEIILGIDPSLRGTGYGIIRMAKPHPTAIAYGTINCPAAWEHSRCLVNISRTLRDVTAKHRPTVCAIEGLFFAQNLKTALIMGEARGAALAAVAEAGLDIFELAPRKVKQAIVGYGAAQKLAVAKMVQRILHLADLPAPDEADALAIALAYAQETSRISLGAPKRV